MTPRAGIAQKKRRGFNLIEAAIVLGVVGAVLGALWATASNFYENYKVNKTVEGIFIIAKNIQRLVSNRDAEFMPEGDITSAMVNASTLPVGWVRSAMTNSPIGTQVKIYSCHANSVCGYGGYKAPVFGISLEGKISQPACTTIVFKTTEKMRQISSTRIHYAGSKDIFSLVTVRGASGSVTALLEQKDQLSLSTSQMLCTVRGAPNKISFDFGYSRIN